MSRDLCVIGSPIDDENGEKYGAAYIFRYTEPNWVQEVKLFAPNEDWDHWDYFGSSVSIDGDICIIGAYGDDPNGESSGSAYIFRYDDPNWVFESKFISPNPEEDGYFGRAVSIDGDVCIIGAFGEDHDSYDVGSAYIFRFNGANWFLEAGLAAEDEHSRFGYSVSLRDNKCIIGAPSQDGAVPNSGAAYIFRYDDPNWVMEDKLTALQEQWDAQFGYSVSLHDDVCIVGASQSCPYVFRYHGSSSNWVQEVKLRASYGTVRDYGFGSSVSISGDTCVVGDPFALNLPSSYVFRFDGRDWIKDQRLDAFDESEPKQFEFGRSVAVDLDKLLIGFPTANENIGAVYAYSLCPWGDLSGDCFVGLADVAELAGEWLTGWNLPQ